ncbi:RagB/SusD family nutrient uptake outer membrane protein [Parapedobacter tibetensis]|uniref:RagB/SusD family nutrient uptake outer membrane protein n=1 Tax=Parapedobacter tibetensis TaxID=2972951 RepID=UPI00214D20F4|nr:RagB/SusD family nutrient uptake outer membrane protein [Parapedobacter tibetensis]
MKKIVYSLFILAVTSTSCNKSFIALSPEDSQSGMTFYQTEAHFRQALAAAYAPLRDVLVNDFYTAEMRTDNTHYEYYEVNRGTAYQYRENIADFTDAPNNAYTNAVYFHCYKGISRANIVIERLPLADIPEEARVDIEGQAKFLRAFNYFRLVRYFGGVPLFLKETKVAEDAFLLRSSAEEVYEQIIADAQEAIDKLQVPADFPQTGEATKGAATMLLAEVYLTLQRYPDAESLLKTLPAMGYQLLPEYASVFSTANKNSRESIFEVQYREGAQGGQQSDFIYRFLPRTANTTPITGVQANNITAGGWNTPTENMIAAYEPDDTRLDASIAIAEGTYNASNVFAITANKSIVGYTPAPGTTSVPYIKKYLNPHSIASNTDDNWPVYRYADALLLLAEALNEQNKSNEALLFLNEVRDRAFGAGISPVTITDQDALREAIAHERRVELAFENHRWFDLLRSGKAVEVLTAYGIAQKEKYNYLVPASYEVTATRLLYPIPQSERELNPDLTQNPGYPF